MILIYMFFLHFIADFALQSREMGKNKSKKVEFLIKHCLIQGVVFFVGLLPLYGTLAAPFAIINMLIHGAIDWHIWRLYMVSVLYRQFDKKIPWKDRPKLVSKKYPFWEDHYFYLTIGFDQFLHMTTLVGLWYYILGGV